MITIQQRFLGGLWGSLVGDALGVPVEFQGREAIRKNPVQGMRSGGTHGQKAGTWSDDGALLLCSAESFVEKGFDIDDMGSRFVRWFELGLWSAHGVNFDIGIATRTALNKISQGAPAGTAGGRDEYDNGNGSLMRILPVALASLREPDTAFADRLCRASAITHGHARAQMACVFHGLVVRALMKGLCPGEAVTETTDCFQRLYQGSAEFNSFATLLSGRIAQLAEPEIGSSGYVMHTLKASLWCLLTTNSFADCVLKAVNLGDDTDTTGCVAGGLAGVCHGLGSIPDAWLEALPRQAELKGLFDLFVTRYATP